MSKTKKLLAVALVGGMLASTGTCAFAADQNGQTVENNTVISNVSQQLGSENPTLEGSIAPRASATASITHDEYWDKYGAKFKFTATTNVIYDSNYGRYNMSTDIVAPRPSITAKKGVRVTTDFPTIRMIDGGRTAEITTRATIQTDYSNDEKTVTVYLNCNSTTGKLSMSLY